MEGFEYLMARKVFDSSKFLFKEYSSLELHFLHFILIFTDKEENIR